MGNSLQDQLVKSGLISKQKADLQRAKAKKRRKPGSDQDRQQREAQQRQAQAEKKERDKALEAGRMAKQEASRIKGQIRVLIEAEAVNGFAGETPYNYRHGDRIRQLLVTPEIHARLLSGELWITRLNGKTRLVPAATGERIAGLNPDWVLIRPGDDEVATGEDPEYAEYAVPDDLVW